MSKKCFSASVMKKHKIKKAKSCSKYSLGVVYSGLAEKWETFKNTMAEIKKIRTQTLKNNTRKKAVKQVRKTLNSTFTTKPIPVK